MILFSPVIVKCMEKYPDITNPCYNEHTLPFPQVALHYIWVPHDCIQILRSNNVMKRLQFFSTSSSKSCFEMCNVFKTFDIQKKFLRIFTRWMQFMWSTKYLKTITNQSTHLLKFQIVYYSQLAILFSNTRKVYFIGHQMTIHLTITSAAQNL